MVLEKSESATSVRGSLEKSGCEDREVVQREANGPKLHAANSEMKTKE